MKGFLNKICILLFIFMGCFSCKQGKSPQYYYSLAVTELTEDRYNNAYNYFTKAIELDSTYGQAYFMRAQILELLHSSKDSVCKDLIKAEELGYKEAKEVRELYCRDFPEEKFSQLKEDYDSYIAKYPDRFEGYYDRANLYFDIGEYKKAIEDYDKAIERREYPVAYYNRGLCYIKLDQKQRGCRDIKKAAELGYDQAKRLLKFCN